MAIALQTKLSMTQTDDIVGYISKKTDDNSGDDTNGNPNKNIGCEIDGENCNVAGGDTGSNIGGDTSGDTYTVTDGDSDGNTGGELKPSLATILAVTILTTPVTILLRRHW